jgi:hypothetical protein
MGQPAKKHGRAAREERERQLILKHKFQTRITSARFGKESLDSSDYVGAIRKFTDYLAVMAEVKGVQDIYSLRVSHFDPRSDVTEMLMISQLYFELARMYDVVPKFQNEVKQCLDQFVHFSVNQPYQVVNSELMRKSLKKSLFKNPEMFREAYTQIFVQSKKCYVVTFCLGDAHPVTHQCREFKDWLLEQRWGQEVVRTYYASASTLVPRWEGRVVPEFLGRYLIAPLLIVFSKVVLPFIIRR